MLLQPFLEAPLWTYSHHMPPTPKHTHDPSKRQGWEVQDSNTSNICVQKDEQKKTQEARGRQAEPEWAWGRAAGLEAVQGRGRGLSPGRFSLPMQNRAVYTRAVHRPDCGPYTAHKGLICGPPD